MSNREYQVYGGVTLSELDFGFDSTYGGTSASSPGSRFETSPGLELGLAAVRSRTTRAMRALPVFAARSCSAVSASTVLLADGLYRHDAYGFDLRACPKFQVCGIGPT